MEETTKWPIADRRQRYCLERGGEEDHGSKIRGSDRGTFAGAGTFTDQLSAALPEIQKVAPADQFTEITDELEFLKKKLDSAAPNKSVVKTIKDELIKRVIGLPFDAAKWFGPEILQGL